MIICQQTIINTVGSTTRTSSVGTKTTTTNNNQYQSGRCNIAAFMRGGPTTKTTAPAPSSSLGSDPISSVVVKASSKKLIICRDIDHNNGSLSQLLKLLSPTSTDDTVESSDETKIMMTNYTNGTKHHFDSIVNAEQDDQQKQKDKFVSILRYPPSSSIATRAAFHEVPPSFSNLKHDDDEYVHHQQQTESLTNDIDDDDDCETCYFLDALQTSPFLNSVVNDNENGASSNLFSTSSSGNGSLPLSRDSAGTSSMLNDDQLDVKDDSDCGVDDCCFAEDYDAGSHNAVLSLLYQRCSKDGQPRLNMFESSTPLATLARVGGDGGIKELGMPTAATYGCASMKDELSHFRSFGASIAIAML